MRKNCTESRLIKKIVRNKKEWASYEGIRYDWAKY